MQYLRFSKTQVVLLVAVILVLAVGSVVYRNFGYAITSRIFGDKSFPIMSGYDDGRSSVMVGPGDYYDGGFGYMPENKMGFESSFMPPMPEPYPYYDDYALDIDQRVYHNSADYSLVVANVDEYLRQTSDMIMSLGGRVLTTSQGKYGRYHSGYLHAMVPVDNFTSVTQKIIQNSQKIQSQSMSSNDETARNYDAQTQVQRLEDQKMQKEIDLLEAVGEAQKKRIQLEIDRLNQRLERAKKQQAQAEQRVEYSTINLSVADSINYFNPDSGFDIRAEIDHIFRSFSTAFRLLVHVLIWVLVYAVVFLPLIVLIRFVWSKSSWLKIGAK